MTMNIVTLDQYESITEPGFYRMPLERHHNQPCDGPSVTSSVLRDLESGVSPAAIWAYHALNPDRLPRPLPTLALRLGAAMACLVEGGEEMLRREFLVLPENRPPRPTKPQIQAFTDGRASDSAMKRITFWVKVDSDKRTLLEHHEFEDLVAMAAALTGDPAAVMLEGEPEITMAWKHEKSGLWVLSRPDTLAFTGMISDYKKMAPAGEPFTTRLVDRRIDKMQMHMQMGLAWRSMFELTGEYPGEVGLLCQSDEPPYFVIPRAIDIEDCEIGWYQCERNMMLFADCLAQNHWPEPGEHVGSFQMSQKKRERLLAEMEEQRWEP